MSETNGSVLNFTRDAAFINRRAQLRRDSGDDMEALRLFRRACAEAPDRLDYRVDVAEMLNRMGCVRASYYEIVDIINDGLLDGADASDDEGYMEAVGAALFGQACNLSSLGFAASAIDLINRARRYPRDEADMDSLNELYTQLIARELTPNGLRTKERFIRKLHMYAESGNTRRAYALARRYLKHNDKRPLAHAAMAWAEMLRGNQPESMEHLVRALAMTKRDPWVLSIAARILIAGERGQAQPALESAFAVSEGPECDEVLLRQAIALGMDYLALDISGRLLENAPGDPYFSACNAAALINTGASARSALNVMRRSLDIYPGDITARHYVKLISDTMPD
ncbi:MAG: tetratricopeptide repeat protein, partial [Christensenellales bacterium]